MRTGILIALLFGKCISYGQSIKDIFKDLPVKLMPYLTETAKDSLLKFRSYTIPGGDSTDTEEYTIEMLYNDYLYTDWGFTTGQNGFFTVELKKFVRTDGSIIVIYARQGGSLRIYDEHELIVFEYSNHQLSPSKTIKLPSVIETKNFFSAKTPAAILKKYTTVSTGYDLNPEEINGIKYTAFAETPELEDYFIPEITYLWNGSNFILKK